MSRKQILVWDADFIPAEKEHLTLLWRIFATPTNGLISLPEIIETQADRLRERYLDFVYGIGEKRYNNKRLVENLEFRVGFSYWWMTLLAEKCNWAKSQHISDIVRLFVLEDILSAHPSEKIILVSTNKELAAVIKELCTRQKREFDWHQIPLQKRKISLNKVLGKSASAFLGGLYYALQFFWKRRSFLHRKPVALAKEQKGVIFVDYLINFNKPDFEAGRYSSNYWTKLHEIIGQAKIKVNWLHLFIEHADTLTPNGADELLTQCDRSSKGKESHMLVEKWLDWAAVGRILQDYFLLLRCHFRLRRVIKSYFCPSDSLLDLWPLYERDWMDSFLGPTAIWNCAIYNLFESALKQLPCQEQGFYLQENQSWEIGFINAWRGAGHGQLIGVPHSTVRFWDLRYFHDRRILSAYGHCNLPLPDYVAVNGPVSRKAFIDGHYSPEMLWEVEALRYLHLGDMKCASLGDKSSVRVLVCGDYVPETNDKLLKMVFAVVSILPSDFSFTVKPHPSCPINYDDCARAKIKITHLSLGELLTDADVVITSNITSAAVDAYCAHVPLISLMDGDGLNMHPLRGLNGYVVFSDTKELAEILRNRVWSFNTERVSYFFLDRDLPRWRSLMSCLPG